MFLIYSILYAAAVLVLFIPEYLKRSGDMRKRWIREKFGYMPQTSSSIWVHAVSVGEVNAALPLIRALQDNFAGTEIILSTVTDTGQKVALSRAPAKTRVVYLPFDMGHVITRAFRRTNPRALIIMETELWPNLFRMAAGRGMPVLVLNGRISEKSSRGYKKIVPFMKKVFSHVSFFGMQSETDALRLRAIGAEDDKVAVVGNFKFDMIKPGALPAWAETLRGPLVVAGSTHRGEESLLASAMKEQLHSVPDLKMIIAPRHPERFDEAEDIIRNAGLPLMRRSWFGAGNTVPGDFSYGVILLDSVGELSAVYGIADLVIIGKSFTGFGGQNPLEAAFWGKPIICGPHMENFPFISDFFNGGGAFCVEAESLGDKIGELLRSPEQANAAGAMAREIFIRNSGAVERAIKEIRGFI